MSDDNQEGESGSWATVVIALSCVLLLIFYVASPGILILLTGDVPEVLMLIYGPLEWLYSNFEPYENYIEWCNVRSATGRP